MGLNRDRSPHARALFAANMKRLRLGKGLSQENLAAAARLHPNYIGSVERHERNISIDNMEKIAAALGVPISILLAARGRKGS